MIRQIRGIAVDTHPTHVVLDVHGVGYLVYTTAKTGVAFGEETTLHTYLAVRETALDLYGFTTKDELSFFELLLTLPKVGPKTAMQILSQADIALLQNSIISQDANHLSKMSGMSKKTAEKIVLGLKDKFEEALYTHDENGVTHSSEKTSFMSDTIDALITLGYPQSDARKVVQQLIVEKPEITKANDAIKEALKLLG
jgi:Holliday junction DNA helicase RuvA